MWLDKYGDSCQFIDAKWWSGEEHRIVGRPTVSKPLGEDPGKHPWSNFKRFEYVRRHVGKEDYVCALYCANRRIAEQFIEVWNDSPGTWQYELLPGPEEEPEEVVSCCPTCKRPW